MLIRTALTQSSGLFVSEYSESANTLFRHSFLFEAWTFQRVHLFDFAG